MNLNDLINPKEIAMYIKELPPEATLDSQLFPNKKQVGMELSMIKGSKQQPVALRQSAFDVNVRPRALSAALDILKKRMPFFKESVLINEEDRQLLLMAMQSNNEMMIEQIASQIFDNYKSLVDGAEVQMKRMRCQAIQNASISITSDDTDIVVDYGAPSTHKETISTAAKKWSAATADIIGDIIRWQKVLTDEGYGKPDLLILTEKTFGYMVSNTAIKGEMTTGLNSGVIITPSMVKSFVEQKLNISIAIVNGTFKNEAGTVTSYYEDNKITLAPKGTLGQTKYGTTPEEADKVYGSGKTECEIVNTGVAITTMLKEDPVNVETKVSVLGMPSFDKVDECFFATVG